MELLIMQFLQNLTFSLLGVSKKFRIVAKTPDVASVLTLCHSVLEAGGLNEDRRNQFFLQHLIILCVTQERS